MSEDRIQSDRPDPRHITNQPRGAREAPATSDEGKDLPKLGSLAQTARVKHLKQARNTLLGIGILMMVVQSAFYFVETNQVRNEIQKEIAKAGGFVDQEKVQEIETHALRFLLIFHGCAVTVGLVFIVMAFFVEKHPVPITALALTLFIGLHVAFAVVDPINLASGWLVKIIVIVALVKALQAGIAAQKEEREAKMEAEFGA